MLSSILKRERRGEARLRCFKAGRVLLSNGNSTLACRIRSQSEDGVRLCSDEIGLIPDTFTLLRQQPDGSRRADVCKVAWRTCNEAGAKLVAQADAAATGTKSAKTVNPNNQRYPV